MAERLAAHRDAPRHPDAHCAACVGAASRPRPDRGNGPAHPPTGCGAGGRRSEASDSDCADSDRARCAQGKLENRWDGLKGRAHQPNALLAIIEMVVNVGKVDCWKAKPQEQAELLGASSERHGGSCEMLGGGGSCLRALVPSS